jgi:excisionase family DNA binding protein
MKTDKPNPPAKFYTIEQIAECIEASTRTVRRWIREKRLIANRIIGVVRVSDANLRKFWDDHEDR